MLITLWKSNCVPNDSARTESWEPTRPYPTIPNIFPQTSQQAFDCLFHILLRISHDRWKYHCERAIISDTTSSATERELEKGGLKMGIPAFAAAVRSPRLLPMQKQPIVNN